MSISPLRLHSASSVQIPSSTRNFNTTFPSVEIRPLNTLSASSVNLHGITNSIVFHNNLRIRLSPQNHTFFGNTLIRTKDVECTLVFLNIMPRGAHVASIFTKPTVTSSVNGTQFSVINNSELD